MTCRFNLWLRPFKPKDSVEFRNSQQIAGQLFECFLKHRCGTIATHFPHMKTKLKERNGLQQQISQGWIFCVVRKSWKVILINFVLFVLLPVLCLIRASGLPTKPLEKVNFKALTLSKFYLNCSSSANFFAIFSFIIFAFYCMMWSPSLSITQINFQHSFGDFFVATCKMSWMNLTLTFLLSLHRVWDLINQIIWHFDCRICHQLKIEFIARLFKFKYLNQSM